MAIKNKGKLCCKLRCSHYSRHIQTFNFSQIHHMVLHLLGEINKSFSFHNELLNQCINPLVISQPSLCAPATTHSAPPSTPSSSVATTGARFPSATPLCKIKTTNQQQKQGTDCLRPTPTRTAQQNTSTHRSTTCKTATTRTCESNQLYVDYVIFCVTFRLHNIV